MKEFNSSTIGGRLTIHGEYNSTLDIESFSRMIKDPSYRYKFYWLEALVVLISQGIAESTFDEVIDEMIGIPSVNFTFISAAYNQEKSETVWSGQY